MTLRALLIDDEPIALEKLRTYAAKVPFLEVAGACSGGHEAYSLLSSTPVDVVFTDINMPDMSGIDFIASLPSPPPVVFITAHADYAVESYRLRAFDYLLKPYSLADFRRAAARVLEYYTTRPTSASDAPKQADYLFIKTDYRYVRVAHADISYIKGCGEYLQIYLNKGATHLMTLSSFSAILEKLPEAFVQVHRSYVVNMATVQSVSKGRVQVADETSIPIGDSYKSGVLSYLATHTAGFSKKIHS